ncbi:BglG family transcription antiterminator [Niallia circulans]|uniref:BglG family transcription antiterminator n=1 Tax=Niallia circulans TaxID=1397 RepID=UPI003D98042D
MRDRYTKLLHILQNSDGFVTGNDISEQLNISSRTVRNDIKDLNDNYLIGARIISNKRQGYQLEGELVGFKQRHHIEFEERAFYIVKALLDTKEWTTYEQLSQMIYFSPQTIRSDIQRISQMITSQKRNLSVEALVFQGIRLEGDEFDKRLLLESLVEKNFMTIKELYKELLVRFGGWVLEEELNLLSTVVIENLNKYIHDIPTGKLSSLLVHLIIAIYRIRHGYEICEVKEVEQSLDYEEFELASKILEDVQEIFQIDIGNQEKMYFSLHLISQRIIVSFYNNETNIPQELKQELEKSLVDLGKQYDFRFNEDRLLVSGLLFHLAKAQYPLQYQLYVENPYISHIKMEYLLAYHIAVLLAHRLEKHLTFVVPESEIGYIALHIAAHIERTKRKKVRVAIVSGSGIGASMILKQKIQRHFLDIEIAGEYTLQMLDQIEENISLIISTMDVKKNGIPIIHVNEFLDEQDLKKIAVAINQGFLDRTLSENRFILLDENNKHDFLLRLTEKVKMEYLLDGILTREEMSSTEVGNYVAMPHPIARTENEETMIYIAINHKPIPWGKTNVQLVFLILPSEVDRENHYKVFKQLYQLVKSKDKVQELIQTKDFQSFMEVLHTN